MNFDKNQETFPSEYARDIWWWAVGIVPLSVSLTDEVKAKCTPDILDGCHQWHSYFYELCKDMYSHENEYLPASARQYRDILENIAAKGEPTYNGITVDADIWEAYATKINKSKAYRTIGITLDRCLNALKRTGLEWGHSNGSVIFSYAKYPQIFYAMHQFQQSPEIRQTPARHQFAHCDFRRLFKNYSENYDELLRRVSDESRNIATSIHEFCKPLRIQRYVHFGTIKYKYNGHRVLDYSLHQDQIPTLRVNISTFEGPKIMIHPRESDIEEIQALILARKASIDGVKHLV